MTKGPKGEVNKRSEGDKKDEGDEGGDGDEKTVWTLDAVWSLPDGPDKAIRGIPTGNKTNSI